MAHRLFQGGGRKEGGNKERNQDKGDCAMMVERLGKNSNNNGDDETMLTPAYGSLCCDGMGKDERGKQDNSKGDSTIDDSRLETEDEEYSEHGFTATQYHHQARGGVTTRLSQLSPTRERILSVSTSNALDNFAMVEVGKGICMGGRNVFDEVGI